MESKKWAGNLNLKTEHVKSRLERWIMQSKWENKFFWSSPILKSVSSPFTTSRSSIDIFVKNLYLFVSNVDANVPGHLKTKTIHYLIAFHYQTQKCSFVRVRLSHCSCSPLNTGYNKQIAEQKESSFLATSLSGWYRDQIERNKLSLVHH